MPTTKQDAERRFAQIEGERDYYKRQAERRRVDRDKLRYALQNCADVLGAPNPTATSQRMAWHEARAALKSTEGE